MVGGDASCPRGYRYSHAVQRDFPDFSGVLLSGGDWMFKFLKDSDNDRRKSHSRWRLVRIPLYHELQLLEAHEDA